jgi:hypothetical protein
MSMWSTAISFRRPGGFPVGSGALVSDIVGHQGGHIDAGDSDYLPPGVALREMQLAEFGEGGPKVSCLPALQ